MLVVIYNCWDGIELLRGSMQTLHVEHYIIVWQDKSNYGEKYSPIEEIEEAIKGFPSVSLIQYEPTITKDRSNGRINEAKKRNIGIKKALELGATHFLCLDVDEYHPDFEQAKQDYFNSGKEGSVLKMWTYFKSPNLRLEKPEGYHVPFIHKLRPDTYSGNYAHYPYRVDPTRAVNTKSVVELPQMMHHYSWVRKDIGRKARNSSARHLSQHLEDYKNAEAGMYIGAYAQKLINVENDIHLSAF